MILASSLGWVAAARLGLGDGFPELCGIGAGTLTWRSLEAMLAIDGVWMLAFAWFAMIAAMTPPLLAAPLGHLWLRSLPRRRARSIGLFLMAYAAAWMAAGPPIRIVAATISSGVGDDVWAASFAGLGAILWQRSPAKAACLDRCHALPPLAAFGLSADRDALKFGFTSGFWCIGTCWALMLAALSAGPAHLPAMAIATIIATAERLGPPRPLRRRTRPDPILATTKAI
ncbi:DUF2182 domain-containing protein [Methylobacterium sp.]|uniref:copper chaperone n=1 Tax=Methylobacterium sp. TaxID=409 RepID=UPI00257E9CF7|nr:DUF2182 domain-containing protein [Methylobacterium sp.]